MNEITLAILELLKDTLRTEYKHYYYGEIRVPEQSSFPYIEVIPMGSKITNKGT